MQNPLVGIPNGAICCKSWPQTILGPPSQIWPKWAQALMVQERVMGLWPIPLARIWGSGGISTEAFLRGSSQSPSQPKSCSTPGLRPGIRPKQKCLGRILGLEHGVEQFSAVSKACSTQANMPRSCRNLGWLNSARPPGLVSETPTGNVYTDGIPHVP